MTMPVHKRFKHIREKADLTQKEVALACNPQVTAQLISQIETEDERRRTPPQDYHLKALSALSGAPIEMIVNESIEMDDSWLISEINDRELVDLVTILSNLDASSRRIVRKAAILQLNKKNYK